MKTLATTLILISLMGSLAHGRHADGVADLSSVAEELESGVGSPTKVPKGMLTDDNKLVEEALESVFGKKLKSGPSSTRKADAATAN